MSVLSGPFQALEIAPFWSSPIVYPSEVLLAVFLNTTHYSHYYYVKNKKGFLYTDFIT